MTVSHGITPAACLIEMTPQASLTQTSGTLKFTFGTDVVTFPDCVIDSGSLRLTSAGFIWFLRVLDRRWRWKYTEISGWYNRRLADGSIDTNLEKTPQELASLCLDAMGEVGYTVVDLPNSHRPEVNWVSNNAANELAILCDAVGCRVVYETKTNRVALRLKGVGAQLPLGPAINESFGLDPAERPDKLKFVGGPTLHQWRLTLEPMGLETDGSIKPIDDLSYKPTLGWKDITPENFTSIIEDVGEDERNLALTSVFRWYRVKVTLNEIPGVQKLWQLLPLRDVLIEKYVDSADNEFRSKPAEVIGTFYNGIVDYANSPARTKYTGTFTVNAERGIVEFSEPVYKFTGTNNEEVAEADITLETSFTILDFDTRQHDRFVRELQLSVGDAVQIIRRDEVVLTERAVYIGGDVSSIIDNQVDVETEADHYLDAVKDQHQKVTAFEVEYAGLITINLDGAIQQITYSVGPGACRTRISRNNEHDLAIPSYERRREIEQVRLDPLDPKLHDIFLAEQMSNIA